MIPPVIFCVGVGGVLGGTVYGRACQGAGRGLLIGVIAALAAAILPNVFLAAALAVAWYLSGQSLVERKIERLFVFYIPIDEFLVEKDREFSEFNAFFQSQIGESMPGGLFEIVDLLLVFLKAPLFERREASIFASQ